MADNDLEYLNNLADEPEAEAEVPEPAAEEPEAEEVEGDEPEVAEDGAEEDEAPKGKIESSDEEPAPRHRKENRVQRLANERNSEREARIRAEAERDALIKYRQTAPAIDNGESVRLRNEKLSLMEPHERAVFLQSEEIQKMQQQLYFAELKSEDRADKAAYESKALVDPRYARHKESVEKRLAEYRSKGANPSRQEVFHLVLGEEIANQKPRKAAREAAGQRVEATKGKPVTSKGNSAGATGKGDSLAEIEARLRGKSFNSMY